MTNSLIFEQNYKSNFKFTFLFLDKKRKDAIEAVYKFCRISDDIVDREISRETKIQDLLMWKEETELSQNQKSNIAFLNYLNDISKEFKIPYDLYFELINGMEMDIFQSEYPMFKDLELYCYRVASVVGFMCLYIFGCIDKRDIEYGKNLGIALQLTNILRDVHIDAKNNRFYIPAEDLQQFNLSKDDLLTANYNSNFVALMEFEYQRALSYYRQAEAFYNPHNKMKLLVSEMMKNIYYQLLQNIKASNYNVFNKRISTSFSDKIKSIINTLKS